MAKAWTSSADLVDSLTRRWNSGILLIEPAASAQFPLAIALARPKPNEFADQFDAVRSWVRELEQMSRSARGIGYDLVMNEVRNQRLGLNSTPIAAIFPTLADALGFIGKTEKAARWQVLVVSTRAACSQMLPWMERHPLHVLEHQQQWDRILLVVEWFLKHSRSKLYLRQIDLPGVDTKFIEQRASLLGSILDELLPPEAIASEFSSARNFAARFGFLCKPSFIRVRTLDAQLTVAGLRDIATPIDQLANLILPARVVFITENETNGLAFPDVHGGVVIYGLGYSVRALGAIPWLHRIPVYYWGDIDTHGFAILGSLRATLPTVQSLMMDQATLFAHRDHWGEELEQELGPIQHLTPEEAQVAEGLRTDAYARRVRLEQEHIGFAWVVDHVRRCHSVA